MAEPLFKHLSKSKTAYKQDFHGWLQAQADSLRSGHWESLDVTYLAEEIEDMGKRERRAVESNLVVILRHLLKYRYQPEGRSSSWLGSIQEHRRRLRRIFTDSPSLRQYGRQAFPECYLDARIQASAETGLSKDAFPEKSPFSYEQTLDSDYLSF
jgi:hypothetical protein